MKNKKSLVAIVATLVLACVMAVLVACSPSNSSTSEPNESSIPKSYSLEGVLNGEKAMPAFLELKEDGSVQLEYIMTMGQPDNTTHTVVTNEGSWTQDDNGVITSVKFISNGDEYVAAVDNETQTITIGYSLDFTTFTVSVADVSESGRNFVIVISTPDSYSFEGVLNGEKAMPAFLELKADGSVQLEYIMTMGQPDNTTHTVVTSEGSWSQDKKGYITSVKLVSNGDEYEAVIDNTAKTITIGYSLDFTTFTVSVADVSENGKNFVISMEAAKAE